MNANLPHLGVQDWFHGEAIVEEVEDGKGQQTKVCKKTNLKT